MEKFQLNRRELALSLSAPLVLGSGAAIASERPKKYSLIGKKAPKFSLNRHKGGTFANSNLKGKTTIIEFWGLWCPDCLLDSPLTYELSQKVKGTKNINLVAIHTAGRYGRWGSIDAYFKEKGFEYDVAIDDDKAAYKSFAIEWVPSYLIIDKHGNIADFTTDLGVEGVGVNAFFARAQAIAAKK